MKNYVAVLLILLLVPLSNASELIQGKMICIDDSGHPICLGQDIKPLEESGIYTRVNEDDLNFLIGNYASKSDFKNVFINVSDKKVEAIKLLFNNESSKLNVFENYYRYLYSQLGKEKKSFIQEVSDKNSKNIISKNYNVQWTLDDESYVSLSLSEKAGSNAASIEFGTKHNKKNIDSQMFQFKNLEIVEKILKLKADRDEDGKVNSGFKVYR